MSQKPDNNVTCLILECCIRVQFYSSANCRNWHLHLGPVSLSLLVLKLAKHRKMLLSRNFLTAKTVRQFNLCLLVTHPFFAL